MAEKISVLGVAGSLRKNSINRGLLRTAEEVLPEDMVLEIFDIANIPLYNEDLVTSGFPEAVREFKAKIASADALLIATPEYNYSIPGVLKNAIDWASRPAKESPLNDKPVAIMGAGGFMGTSRAQAHLRQVAVFTNMHPLNKPEVQVQRAWEKFDSEGNLMDEQARESVHHLLVALDAWTRRLKGVLNSGMLILHILAFAAGFVLAAGTIFSAIETFVVPRSVQDSLTRIVFLVVRAFFSLVLRRAKTYESRDRIMSYYAPIALIALLPVWYVLVLVGFALMFWGIGAASVLEAFRESGSSLLTLGFAPAVGFGRTALTFIEAAIGLILVALLIAYLPTMYSAFSRREAAVTMLEVRAGAPPSAIELILRYHRIHGLERLSELWGVWEAWFADVEESHSSLTPLVFFRSPAPNRSWVTAAGAVLDAASLTLSAVDIPNDAAAALCIRAGYITLRRIGEFFGAPYNPNPARGDRISISRQEFNAACATLAEKGVPMKANLDEAWLDFTGWRTNYDQSLLALASVTMAPFAPWSSDRAKMVWLPPIAHLKKKK